MSQRLAIALAEAASSIDAVDDAAVELIRWAFPDAVDGVADRWGSDAVASVETAGTGTFRVSARHGRAAVHARAEALTLLSALVAEDLAMATTEGTTFHAALAERDGRCVLLPGVSGVGKSTTALVLRSRGFRILTDELAWVSSAGYTAGLRRPIGIKRPVDPVLLDHVGHSFADAPMTDFVRLLDPAEFLVRSGGRTQLSAIVFVRIDPEREAGARRLTAAEAAECLLSARWVAPDRRSAAFTEIAALARSAPAIEVIGREADSIADLVETFIDDSAGNDSVIDLRDHAKRLPTVESRPNWGDLDPLSRQSVAAGSDAWTLRRVTSGFHQRLHLTRSSTASVLVRVPDVDSMPTLRMWRDYFPHASVVGAVGGIGELPHEDRITTMRVATLFDRDDSDGLPFDVVIDAGGGDADSSQRFFDAVFGQVVDGGWYVADGTVAALAVASGLLTDLHHAELRSADESMRPGLHALDLAAVELERGCCFVRRGSNRRRSARATRLTDQTVQHTLAVLDEARKHLPVGQAELALARVYEALREDGPMIEWARAALEAGSTDVWAMRLLTNRLLGDSGPHR